MNDNERKELHTRAYGKPILFVPQHWTLYEWVSEQPGTSLRDKLFGIVQRAYKADCLNRAERAGSKYARSNDKQERLAALNEAIEYYRRAGHEDHADHLVNILRYELMKDEPVAA